MTEGWHLIHWTYDPNREIGSVPATERTTVGSWNHNPLAEAADEIERLRSTIQLDKWVLQESADEIERLTKSNTILRDALEQIITGLEIGPHFVDPYTCGRHALKAEAESNQRNTK